MNVRDIPKNEQKFRTTDESRVLKPFSIPIPGADYPLRGLSVIRKDRYGGYCRNEVVKKQQIVIHYTVGHIRSDVITLTPKQGKSRISVAWVIAREGTLYNLFHSGKWSSHLGIKNGVAITKASIGIELTNYGPLKLSPDGKNLETAYSRAKWKDDNGKVHTNPVDIYCSINETDAYEKLDKLYRGYQYFATHTDAQYDSLIVLLRYLCKVYDVPAKFLPEEERYVFKSDARQYKGILSHVNYRKTGKTDIGPAFDWDRVIKGVTASSFKPGVPSALELASAAGTVAGVGLGGLAVAAQNIAEGVKFTHFNNEDEMSQKWSAGRRGSGNEEQPLSEEECALDHDNVRDQGLMFE